MNPQRLKPKFNKNSKFLGKKNFLRKHNNNQEKTSSPQIIIIIRLLTRTCEMNEKSSFFKAWNSKRGIKSNGQTSTGGETNVEIFLLIWGTNVDGAPSGLGKGIGRLG